MRQTKHVTSWFNLSIFSFPFQQLSKVPSKEKFSTPHLKIEAMIIKGRPNGFRGMKVSNYKKNYKLFSEYFL